MNTRQRDEYVNTKYDEGSTWLKIRCYAKDSKHIHLSLRVFFFGCEFHIYLLKYSYSYIIANTFDCTIFNAFPEMIPLPE